MHIVSRKAFYDAAKNYPNDADAIDALYKTLKAGHFKSPDELKMHCPSLDNFKFRDKWWVIDIGGNNLRLIAYIDFLGERIFIKQIINQPNCDKLCKRYNRGEL